MNWRYWVLAVAAVAGLQAAAFAEMITGTISGVDPQAKSMTIIRADNQKEITVSVQNENQLLGLQPGGRVTVDAGRGLLGGWKAENVVAAGAAEPSGNQGNLNTGAAAGADATAAANADANPGL